MCCPPAYEWVPWAKHQKTYLRAGMRPEDIKRPSWTRQEDGEFQIKICERTSTLPKASINIQATLSWDNEGTVTGNNAKNKAK